MVDRSNYPVLTTMLMKNKDIDALNRVAFVGAADGTTATTFVADDADQGTIVKIDKMVEFSGYNKMTRNANATYGEDWNTYEIVNNVKIPTRTFGAGNGEGYSFTATKAAADDEGDLWIVDNHEVGYTVIYQQRVSIDPRKFTNEAGRAVSIRKVSKGDFIQVTSTAFTANNAPDLTPAVATNKKDTVVIDAGGKLKAIKAGDLAQGKHAVFKVVGKTPMEFGYDRADAWILEATQYAD